MESKKPEKKEEKFLEFKANYTEYLEMLSEKKHFEEERKKAQEEEEKLLRTTQHSNSQLNDSQRMGQQDVSMHESTHIDSRKNSKRMSHLQSPTSPDIEQTQEHSSFSPQHLQSQIENNLQSSAAIASTEQPLSPHSQHPTPTIQNLNQTIDSTHQSLSLSQIQLPSPIHVSISNHLLLHHVINSDYF